MTVTVRVIGPLAYAAGFSERTLAVPDPTTAGQLLARVRLADRPSIVTRNGKAVSAHDVLVHGDRVVISPIYSGG